MENLSVGDPIYYTLSIYGLNSLEAIQLEKDRFICVSQLGLLEAIAAYNLNRFPKEKERYSQLVESQKKYETSLERLLEKAKKGEDIDENDEDKKTFEEAYGNIKKIVLSPNALNNEDERLRYRYYKRVFTLLNQDIDFYPSAPLQIRRKRKARAFLWDLLRKDVLQLVQSRHNPDALKEMGKLLVKTMLHCTSYQDENKESPAEWLKNYGESLDEIKKGMNGYFADYPEYDATKIDNAIYNEKAEAWGVVPMDRVPLLGSSLSSNKKYQKASARLEDLQKERQSISSSNYFSIQAKVVLLTWKTNNIQAQQKQLKEIKNEHFEKVWFGKIREQYHQFSELTSGKAKARFISEFTAGPQAYLGQMLGQWIGSQEAPEAEDWGQLVVEVVGCFAPFLPGGPLLYNIGLGLFQGLRDKKKKETQTSNKDVVIKITERIDKLESHIDEKIGDLSTQLTQLTKRLEHSLKLQSALNRYSEEISKKKTLFGTNFKVLLRDRVHYQKKINNELEVDAALKLMTNIETHLVTILTQAYGIHTINDFLNIVASSKPTSESIQYLDENGNKVTTDKSAYLNQLKSLHLSDPLNFSLTMLQKQVEEFQESLVAFLDLMVSYYNGIGVILADLSAAHPDKTYSVERNKYYAALDNFGYFQWQLDQKNLNTKQPAENKSMTLLQKLKTQVESSLSFLIGEANTALLQNWEDDANRYTLEVSSNPHLYLSSNEDDNTRLSFIPFKDQLPSITTSKRTKDKKDALVLYFIDKQKSNLQPTIICTDQFTQGRDLRALPEDNKDNKLIHFYPVLSDKDGYFKLKILEKTGGDSQNGLYLKKGSSNRLILGDGLSSDDLLFKFNIQDKPSMDFITSVEDMLPSLGSDPRQVKLRAKFLPGDAIQLGAKYYSTSAEGTPGKYYVTLDGNTNNLEIRQAHNDAVLWKAIDNPPKVEDYSVFATMQQDGNLVVYQFPKDRKKQETEKPKAVWSSQTDGFSFSNLELIESENTAFLQLRNRLDWLIWQSAPIEQRISLDGKYFTLAAQLENYEHAYDFNPYVELITGYSAGGRPTKARAYRGQKKRNLTVHLCGNNYMSLSDRKGKGHHAVLFKASLIDPNKLLYHLECIPLDEQHRKFEKGIAALHASRYNDFCDLLVNHSVNKENEMQWFYIYPLGSESKIILRPYVIQKEELAFPWQHYHQNETFYLDSIHSDDLAKIQERLNDFEPEEHFTYDKRLNYGRRNYDDSTFEIPWIYLELV